MSIKTEQPQVPFWYDFFKVPEDDKSTLKVQRTIVLDSNTNSAVRTDYRQKKVTFEIKKRESYVDLHHSGGFRWRGKLVDRATRADLAAGAFNDFLGVVGCMFARIRIEVSGKEIELNTDTFLRNCFQGHLENRLTDPVVRDTSGYFPETDLTEPNGRLAADCFSGATPKVSINSVFVDRLLRRNGVSEKYDSAKLLVAEQEVSNELELFIPLSALSSFIRDNEFPIVSNSVKIDIDLTEENVIKGFKQSAAAAANSVGDALLQTTFIQLEYDEVMPSDVTQKWMLEKRMEDPIIYRMWKRYETETFSVLQTAANGAINTLLGTYTSRPDRVFVAVQSQPKAQKLNQCFNYSTFDRVNLESIELKINGSTTVPLQAWEYDIGKREMIQMYKDYVAAQRMYSNEDSGLMPYNLWLQNYQIYCFDLRHLGDGVFKNNMDTQIYFQAKWKATPVVHPYASVLGSAIALNADDVLPAEAQHYQFIKHVEIPCSATIDLTTGSMVIDSLVN